MSSGCEPFSGHLRDSWNFHKRVFCRRGYCPGSGGRAIGKEYFSDSKGQRSQKKQAEEDHQVAGGGPGSRGIHRQRNHCKKNLNDNGYFDKNYVRSFAGTENEKVMNSLFSSLNRNYGVLEYSNDSGSKKFEIVAKEYMRGKLLRSKVCSTMQIRRGEGMIGVLLDSDKGEYMVSVGDSEGVGGMESAVENPVVANENKMTSVGFLQGTAFMEDGPIPIAAYYADAEGDSFSTVPAERILETNGKCLKESGVDYCLIITCEFK